MKKITLILSFLVICISGCRFADSSNTNTKSAYDKVLESKTLKVGYLSYPPGFIKDPNTKQLSGIFHDVLAEAGRNLELDVQFSEEVGWGTMIEALKTGRVDVICAPIWPTSQRGKQADFTIPLYFSPVKAYTKMGNNKFDNNLSGINSKQIKIATLDGEMSSIISKFDFPKAKTEAISQNSDVSQLLLNVANGKADITFVEPVIAHDFVKNNQNKIKEVQGIKPLRVFPNVMMLSKGEVKLTSTLNTAIEELANNGFVDKAIAKYEPFPNAFYRLQPKYKIN
jgi:ABC-type amino acid transport substrate-binding protein